MPRQKMTYKKGQRAEEEEEDRGCETEENEKMGSCKRQTTQITQENEGGWRMAEKRG